MKIYLSIIFSENALAKRIHYFQHMGASTSALPCNPTAAALVWYSITGWNDEGRNMRDEE